MNTTEEQKSTTLPAPTSAPAIAPKKNGKNGAHVHGAHAFSQEKREAIPIELGKLSPSPFQHRKVFLRIDELAETIKEHGQETPALVRPLAKDRFEIVFGERRLRAMTLLNDKYPGEFPTLLCFVKEMGEEDAREKMQIENLQREDVTELEEADGFREYLAQPGKSVDELAAKIGKSRAHIFARLKLASSGKEARKAWEADPQTFTASHLLLVARIPPQLQARAVAEILGKEKDTRGHEVQGPAMSYRDALEHVQKHYMLILAKAPFDPKDAALTKAGACGDCPKNTRNQKELFPDVKAGADICTDPTCYAEKRRATWEAKAKKLRAGGNAIDVTAADEKKMTAYGWLNPRSAGYQDLDADRYYASGKTHTIRSVVAKMDPKPRIYLVWDDRKGDGRELVKDADIDPVLRKLARQPSDAHDKKTKERIAKENKKRKEEAKIDEKAKELLGARLAEKAAKTAPSAAFWRTVATIVLEHYQFSFDAETLDRAFIRRGLLDAEKAGGGVVLAYEPKKRDALLEKIKPDDARGLLVEVLALAGYETEMAEVFGVDTKAIGKDAKRALEEEAANLLAMKAAAKEQAKAAKGAGKPKGLAKAKGKK